MQVRRPRYIRETLTWLTHYHSMTSVNDSLIRWLLHRPMRIRREEPASTSYSLVNVPCILSMWGVIIIVILPRPVYSLHRPPLPRIDIVIETVGAENVLLGSQVGAFQPLGRQCRHVRCQPLIDPMQIQHIINSVKGEVSTKRADAKLRVAPLLTDLLPAALLHAKATLLVP